jgi:lysophospholipase L1-like esterase
MRMQRLLRRVGSWLVALVVCLTAGEIASRLDDELWNDTPFFANPDRESDLVLHDTGSVRGRPGGTYKKWKLNAYGFRGPEIAQKPSAGVRRVMLLGASETFGLYESADHEFAAVLQRDLVKKGRDDIEIVNASIAGLGLPTMTRYWDRWASRFDPALVVVYPSPQFYLDDEVPRLLTPAADPEPMPHPWRSRFAERVLDTVKSSDLLKSIRLRLHLSRALAGKPVDWLFGDKPPADRLAAYVADLEALCDAIVAKGSRPVLVTHAFKTPSPPAPSDRFELEYFRIFFPRATADSFPAFDEAARLATIELGQRRSWPVIDASDQLSGHREWFGDPVHFNDAGSERFARLLADDLPPLLTTTSGGR